MRWCANAGDMIIVITEIIPEEKNPQGLLFKQK